MANLKCERSHDGNCLATARPLGAVFICDFVHFTTEGGWQKLSSEKLSRGGWFQREAVVNDTTQNFAPQPYTVFGCVYVQEQHSDAADRHLPPSDIGKVIESLKASMFTELMKSLRSALHLERQA